LGHHYLRLLQKWTQKITNDTIFSRVDRKDDPAKSNKAENEPIIGHVARMGVDRKLKTVMFGVMYRGKEQKRKTTQTMGRRHRRLGRGYTAETVGLLFGLD